jgi:DNA invertase Pin-like site-specific DNA recombinase
MDTKPDGQTTAGAAVVYIYDRHTTPDADALRRRLEACSAYAREQGWDIGGWHVDEAPGSLTEHQRPAMETLLRLMRQTPPGHQRILLVHGLDRLSDSHALQGAHLRLVRSAGGSTRTVVGDGADEAADHPGHLSKLARAV